jgi:TRAP-type uncharacterized transport system substrate-binding protein
MAAQKTKVVLGTATPGGGFPAYGWPYAEALNAADATLDIEPINTKGSGENVGRIDNGELDIALATGEVTYEAVNGIGRAKTSASSTPPIRRRACSWCAPTVRTKRLPTSSAKPWSGAHRVRVLSCWRVM